MADITDGHDFAQTLTALFANGVGLVTTSNFKPNDLYPGGLHRDRIAVLLLNLLNQKLEVINVDNRTDYRSRNSGIRCRAVPRPARPVADAPAGERF